ncbi:hypothetical protein C8Q72DRAFT_778702 [Fomitopsis betulina]|nr:hypothetical protein C8Q72DRAFT_778702 [Fomitopsis betulina]
MLALSPGSGFVPWLKQTRSLLSRALLQRSIFPLSTPYPDLFHWVCETAEIAELWDDWVHKAKLADQRMSRRPMLIEDPEKLAIIIAADQNAIIRDSETGEIVALVIRDWCADPAVVVWVNSVVAQAVGLKRHIRKEDPGKLVLVGYSAGSRSRPAFDWSRNLLLKKHTEQFIHTHKMAVSSNFALFFNSMDACLPNELLTDLREYLRSNNLCRMDGNRAMGAVLRSEGSEVIAFAHEKLAPPSGVMGANYARLSCMNRAVHWEHHPHKFGYSWTTDRNTDCGGSFYVASHGIKVEQAANTFIAWQPRLPHGTSMLACKPQQMEEPFMSRVDESAQRSAYPRPPSLPSASKSTLARRTLGLRAQPRSSAKSLATLSITPRQFRIIPHPSDPITTLCAWTIVDSLP